MMWPERRVCGVDVGAGSSSVAVGKEWSVLVTSDVGVKVGSRVGVGRAACTVTSVEAGGGGPQLTNISEKSIIRIKQIRTKPV
jgi:hypothetical protein